MLCHADGRRRMPRWNRLMCGHHACHKVSRRAFTRALAGAAALSVATAHAADHDAPVEPRIHIANAPPDQRIIALTFDCCPGAFDARIATVLIEQRIPATIFVTGLWIRRNRAGLALLLAHPDLFAIENHGELHIPPVLGDRTIFGIRAAGDLPAIRQEIDAGAETIRTAAGTAPRWYRAATGFYTPSVIPQIQAMGFSIAGYSLSADLGASLPAPHVAARMANAHSGDVIVAHLNQPLRPSGQGIVDGLRALQTQGTTFVRLDQATTTPPT
jgi:peptidoglycan/xylan/chitin deacetylase (PgdA/CDA1 family)